MPARTRSVCSDWHRRAATSLAVCSTGRPPEAGRFVLLLAEQGFPVLPVGAYEENGEFNLRFGAAYRLELPRGLDPDEKDRAVAKTVMTAIAAQLPARLRGGFG